MATNSVFLIGAIQALSEVRQVVEGLGGILKLDIIVILVLASVLVNELQLQFLLQ